MGQYTSYYLYQRYEQREGQDPIPCTPNVYSVDGYGTMEKVIKIENDPDCGYVPPTPTEPIYRWYQIPITEDYICNDCGDTPTPPPTGDYKLYFTTSNAEYQINCNSSSTLTMNEISAYTYDASCCCFRDMRTAVIGDCVTSIGKDAFHPYRAGVMYYNYPSLSSVTMSDNVTSIGESAFERCYGLTSVGLKNSNASIKIPYSVTSIGNSAFEFCTGLTSVTLSSYVTSINDGTFSGCYSLESINMLDVETIGEDAFANCHSLTSITFPSTLKRIKDEAFVKCGLINITIPNSVSGIGTTHEESYAGTGAFAHNSGLTNVTIGSGVTLIGDETFYDTPSLTTVTMNSTIPPSGGSWMFGDENINPNLKIYVPCGTLQAYKEAPYWSSYAQYIFAQEGCPPEANKLEITYTDSSTLTIECGASSAVTSSDTIANRDSIEKIVIGECATSISANAFRYLTGLTSCTIGDNISSIGNSAFTNCISLTSITVNPTTPPTLGRNALLNTNNCLIYVPCSSVNTYKTASGWSTYTDRILGIPPCDTPNLKWLATYTTGTTSAVCDSTSAIKYGEITPTNLVSVTVGDCVRTIGGRAFQNYSGLTSCTIGSGVTSIDGIAFSGCTSLTSIEIPNSVTTIGVSAFTYCTTLTSCTIGSGVISIDESAFKNCSGLTSVTINATTPPTLGDYYGVFGNTNNCPIYVPSEAVNTYKNNSYWSKYASRIQAIP